MQPLILVTLTGTPATTALEDLIGPCNANSDDLDCKVEEKDASLVAEHFDHVELYLSQFDLTPAEKGDVMQLRHAVGTQTAMIRCLQLWRKHNPSRATLRSLLEILLELKKEEIAWNVWNYYRLKKNPKHNISQVSSKWKALLCMGIVVVLVVVVLIVVVMWWWPWC